MARLVWRYTLAIAIVLAVVVLKALVPGLGTTAPFLLVSLTVGLVSWLTGRGPGLVAAVIAAVLVNELFVDRGAGETQSLILLVAGLADFTFMAVVASQLKTSLADAARVRRNAEDATRARDAFLSTVAHELRTPLTSVLAYAELLGRRLGGDGHGGKEAQAIIHGTRRANKLIEDLLQASRFDVTDLRIDAAPVDLSGVARSAMTSLAPRLGPEDHVELILATEAPVLGDAMRLEQVLVNLLDNALKYSPNGASVELRVSVEAQHVVARVSDRGVGVPPEHVAQLFAPFYRARPGVASGLGLGLYVSEAIARGHGGTLAFEPRPEGGSTFVLRLPAHRSVRQRGAAHRARAEAAVPNAVQSSVNVEQDALPVTDKD